MYGKAWGLRASLRCDESEYTPVSEASWLYSRTGGVPSRASFSPGASIQNSFFSNSSILKNRPPITHPSDYSCPQKPQVKMGQTQGRGWALQNEDQDGRENRTRTGTLPRRLTLAWHFWNTLEGAFLLGSSNSAESSVTPNPVLAQRWREWWGWDTESMRGKWEQR